MSATLPSVPVAKAVGDALGVDWSTVSFEEFRLGLDVEREHGRHRPATDVTHDDPILTAKIALAHLYRIPDYYSRLARMEAEAAGVARGLTSHRLTGEPD